MSDVIPPGRTSYEVDVKPCKTCVNAETCEYHTLLKERARLMDVFALDAFMRNATRVRANITTAVRGTNKVTVALDCYEYKKMMESPWRPKETKPLKKKLTPFTAADNLRPQGAGGAEDDPSLEVRAWEPLRDMLKAYRYTSGSVLHSFLLTEVYGWIHRHCMGGLPDGPTVCGIDSTSTDRKLCSRLFSLFSLAVRAGYLLGSLDTVRKYESDED